MVHVPQELLSHSDGQCYHQRNGSRNSSADSKSTNDETFVGDSNVTDCDKCSYTDNRVRGGSFLG